MRLIAASVMIALTISGCSKPAETNNTTVANYTPPTVTSRADFGGQIERRFHRLDKNGDDKLEPSELPERQQARFTRFDTDGNGSISSEEWGKIMLDRFDAEDANRDGTVSSTEREQRRNERRARRATTETE